MAQDDICNHNAPPATSSDSMSPGKDTNQGEDAKSSSHLVVVGAIDKGKAVAKTEGGDPGGRSNGKISTPDFRSGGRCVNRELHIITERNRRERMSDMFTKLRGLLPTLPDKVDKSSIVMEAIHYIKSLEGTLSELEKHKLEMQLAQGKVGAAAHGGVSSSAAAIAPTALVALAPVVPPIAGIWPTGAALAPAVTADAVTVAPGPVRLQTWSGLNIVLSLSSNDACIAQARRADDGDDRA